MLTELEAKLLTNALGAKGHRNYYTANLDSEEFHVFTILVGRGFAQVAPVVAGLGHVRVFNVTDAGRAALRVHNAKDGRGNPIVADALYYVEDSRSGSIVGNCVSWWRANNAGYACDLDDAGKYTGLQTISMRDEDVPWPVDFIEQHKHIHVRVEPLDHVRAKPRPTPAARRRR